MKKLLKFLALPFWIFLYAFACSVDFISKKVGKLLLLTLVIFTGIAIVNFWIAVFLGMKNEQHPLAAVIIGIFINLIYPIIITSFFMSKWEWKELTIEKSIK